MILPSCATVPITERKQLSIIPEYKINSQVPRAYEQFRSKAKLIKSGSQLNEVISIGKELKTLLVLFQKKGQEDPTQNFAWDYVLVDDDKVVNAWCMPGGKIARLYRFT